MDEDSCIKLCRLCLRKPEEEPSWLTNENIKEEFREALSDVELKETNRLSQIICQSCMNLIQTIRNFKQTINRNQSFLLLLLQKPNWGQCVEVNVINPEIKEEEFVDIPLETSLLHKEDLLLDQVGTFVEESNYEPSEKYSLSDENLIISDNDSKINSNTLSRYHITLRTRSDSKPFVEVHLKLEEKPLNCVRCNLHFRTQTLLDKHNRDTHIVEDYPFACTLCTSARFVSEEILDLHNKRHDSDEAKRGKPFACSACELRFSRKYRRVNHVKFHESNELSSCQICGATIHWRYMTEHVNIHKRRFPSDKESNYEPSKKGSLCDNDSMNCVRCNLHFRTQRSLDIHNRKMHIVEDHPFACELCISSRFVSEEILNLHKKRHAKRKNKSFACSACELRFYKKSMLDSHTKNHESNDLESCQICGATIHRWYMPKHLNIHKKNEENYKHVCSLCENGFPVASNKKTHKPPEFECDKCGKMIKRMCNFAYHVKKCRGSQIEFPCKFCGQKFPFRSAKYKHEYTVHKEFKCKRHTVRPSSCMV